jgi:predicted DNA-binding transcriptional regulator AlpA
MTSSRDLIPLGEVLRELGGVDGEPLPRSTFFRWKATGKAPRTIKYPNRSIFVRRCDLDAWLSAHEEPGHAA